MLNASATIIFTHCPAQRRSPRTRRSRFPSSTRTASAPGKPTSITLDNFQTQSQPQNVDVRIAFSNAEAAGLGAPLPRGIVRVYARDSQGRAQFIGEDNIGHTPGGSDISLKIGDAFDVTVQPTIKSQSNPNRRTTDTTMEYLVRNARPEEATVTLRQRVSSWRTNLEIREESIEHRQPDANSFVWDVVVPANGETTLTFTLRQTRRY